MTPQQFWITMAATSVGYQTVKFLLGFKFDGDALIGCFVWNFIAMYFVAKGWVKP